MKPTAFKIKKQFNAIRREQFPWTWEVPKNASDQPFLDLGKATGTRITETADWWFVSIQVEMPDTISVKNPTAIGIVVELNRLATLSTSERNEKQAFLKTALSKLRRVNKRLHRRKLGSHNREKARR